MIYLNRYFYLKRGGEILNKKGLDKLKLYAAANWYGVVKRASNKRLLEWVIDNIKDIINIENKFGLKCKQPIQSLAACLELCRYHLYPIKYTSIRTFPYLFRCYM